MVPFRALTDAVGRTQTNRPIDVAIVQDLVGRISPEGKPIQVDGVAGSRLFLLIEKLQKDQKHGFADGVISPGGQTFNEFVSKLTGAYAGPEVFLADPGGRWKNLDRNRFVELFAKQFSSPPPNGHIYVRPSPGGLRNVLERVLADSEIADLRWAAYMLATVQLETGNFEPIEEFGKGRGYPYGRPQTYVGPDKNKYKNVYYGRGYVQLTWLANYKKLSLAIGFSDILAKFPDKVLEPEVAYPIMSVGMRKGLFTGVGLGNYINSSRCDYPSSRMIINGTDKKDEIADCAGWIEGLLWLSQGDFGPSIFTGASPSF